MSPGGSSEVVESLLPLLRGVAAKDGSGRPYTGYVGPGCSGHYVKMVHKGIEHGMLSVIAEVWYILTQGMGFAYHQVANVFKDWNKHEDLRRCFLLEIAIDINRARTTSGQFVLAEVQDKVVQDKDDTEGTGTWTCEEAVRMHVPARTILAAHFFRCASADRSRRIATQKAAEGGVSHQEIAGDLTLDFLDDLRKATYFGFLLCFAQGLNIIRQKDKEMEWNIHYPDLLQLWRGGCIIQADAIVDLLAKVYDQPDHDKEDILSNVDLAKSILSNFPSAKRVVLNAIEADLVIPSLSQSLEFWKYSCSSNLPTQFMETQLDYFGQHMFDLAGEPAGKAVKGKHHFEWKASKGLLDG